MGDLSGLAWLGPAALVALPFLFAFEFRKEIDHFVYIRWRDADTTKRLAVESGKRDCSALLDALADASDTPWRNLPVEWEAYRDHGNRRRSRLSGASVQSLFLTVTPTRVIYPSYLALDGDSAEKAIEEALATSRRKIRCAGSIRSAYKNKPAGTCLAGHSLKRVERGSVRGLPAWPARGRC